MNTLHPDVHIGHVHLRVADLQCALNFYHDILGFGIFANLRPLGLAMAFRAAGAYHHHIALNASEAAGDAAPPPAGHTGLHHVAIVFPNRDEWVKAVKRVVACGYPVTSAYDHQLLKDPTATLSICTTTAPAVNGSTTRAGPSLKTNGSS